MATTEMEDAEFKKRMDELFLNPPKRTMCETIDVIRNWKRRIPDNDVAHLVRCGILTQEDVNELCRVDSNTHDTP